MKKGKKIIHLRLIHVHSSRIPAPACSGTQTDIPTLDTCPAIHSIVYNEPSRPYQCPSLMPQRRRANHHGTNIPDPPPPPPPPPPTPTRAIPRSRTFGQSHPFRRSQLYTKASTISAVLICMCFELLRFIEYLMHKQTGASQTCPDAIKQHPRHTTSVLYICVVVYNVLSQEVHRRYRCLCHRSKYRKVGPCRQSYSINLRCMRRLAMTPEF